MSDEEKAKFADIPTNPFYDTIITVGFSVEFEFGITEGTLDFGKIISAIVGNLTASWLRCLPPPRDIRRRISDSTCP